MGGNILERFADVLAWHIFAMTWRGTRGTLRRMKRTRNAVVPWLLATLSLGALGCPRRPMGLQPPAAENPNATTVAAPRPMAIDGASCEAKDDCPGDQNCVSERCTPRNSSVAGEVWLSGANAKLAEGDDVSALVAYQEALRAFEATGASAPAQLVCGLALTSLRTASGKESFEEASRRADRCFRRSLVGSTERQEVIEALAAVRHQGIDLARFDQEAPAEQFVTKPAARPSFDQLRVSIDSDPSNAAVIEALSGAATKRALSECFVRTWDAARPRSVSVELPIGLGAAPNAPLPAGTAFGACVGELKLNERVARAAETLSGRRVVVELRVSVGDLPANEASLGQAASPSAPPVPAPAPATVAPPAAAPAGAAPAAPPAQPGAAAPTPASSEQH